MTQRAWPMIGVIFASLTYWAIALVLWLVFAMAYGDCGTLLQRAAVRSCQNEKVLIVWGVLAAIILIYVTGLFIAFKRRSPADGS